MSDSFKDVLIDNGYPVALSDQDTRFIYNLLPVGEFYDKRYGRVSITHDMIKQMAENFGKCPAYEVPVKLGHEQGAKSPGKVIDIQAKPEGLEITMLVDADTAQAINDKQYRYMSAEFDEDYHDKKTGEKVGAVLLGAALVNQPANPYVAPLVLADDINPIYPERNDYSMNEVDDLKLQLSDEKAQRSNLSDELKSVQHNLEIANKKLAELEEQNKALIAERERVENSANEAEVTALCEKWTAQGVPPVMIEKVKPLLLNKNSRIIKLSDDEKDDTPSIKFFGELFELMPKVPMTQISSSDTPKVELSDVQKAKEHAKAIADSIK